MLIQILLISFLMLCGNDSRCATAEVNTWEDIQEQNSSNPNPTVEPTIESEPASQPDVIGPQRGIGYPWAGVTQWDTGYCPLVDGWGWNGNSNLTWPVYSRDLNENRPFSITHTGIDITTPEGSDVRAAAPGVVVWAGKSTYGFGELVVLAHGDGWQTFYAHMLTVWNEEDGNLNLECGQFVEAGRSLGLSGQTGAASWPHLHFEVRQGWMAYNPLPYLDWWFAYNGNFS